MTVRDRIVELRRVPAEELRANPRNWRRHPKHQATALRSMLDQVGFANAVIARETPDGLELIDGHLRQEITAGELVPVLVLDVDEDEAALILATLDPLGAMAVTDEQALWELLQSVEVPDEVLRGALEDMTGQAGPPPIEDPDEIPEPPADPITNLGDLWVLGDHQLICGDAFDPAVLDRLQLERVGAILTDPPYGIDLDTDYSKIGGSAKGRAWMDEDWVKGNRYKPVGGDAGPFDASALVERFAGVQEQFWFGANYYRRTLSPSDLDGSWLVWDKRPAALQPGKEGTDDIIGSGFELIWSRTPHQQRVLRLQWTGVTARNWDFRREHPTEKPVSLLGDILDRWGPKDLTRPILDPFAGGGTTLIACQLAERPARLVEIDPAYCDVIVTRWENFTGGTAEREDPPTEAEGS